VIFVEGIAEQLLIPCFADYVDLPIETHHIAVVAVAGVTFKHFLPIFGAGTYVEGRQFALRRPVACIIDPDPTRKEKEEAGNRKNCWPYQLHRDSTRYDYFPESAALTSLRQQSQHAPNIRICSGKKTLEYDIAEHNYTVAMLITAACTYEAALHELSINPTELPSPLQKKLEQESAALASEIAAISDPDEERRARFATYYLLCTEDEKGEHAFDLVSQLRENLAKPVEQRMVFQTPKHIEEAIHWACSESIGKPFS
jgi:putative ATP-dependent endonuclease of OLD family